MKVPKWKLLYLQERTNKMKRRDFLKSTAVGTVTPLILLEQTKAKEVKVKESDIFCSIENEEGCKGYFSGNIMHIFRRYGNNDIESPVGTFYKHLHMRGDNFIKWRKEVGVCHRWVLHTNNRAKVFGGMLISITFIGWLWRLELEKEGYMLHIACEPENMKRVYRTPKEIWENFRKPKDQREIYDSNMYETLAIPFPSTVDIFENKPWWA